MKVILLQDVKPHGKKGDVVEINDGYARNYILPKKLGVEANAANANDLKLQKANQEKIAAKQLADAKEMAAKLEQIKVVLKIKTGEGGKTFGSITAKEIAAELKKQHNLDIDKKKIVVADPIKSVGSFTVTVKLHTQVSASLSVNVDSE
ncbi:MAG: 50S ribosomal protein L9 [Lachnospiraceae bacterium]|nr:50S ribosomal protein L9 [Lachnospiraceae bacterium]MBR4412126.1 50S ribosomal protein L9 [Lachnospiraceae bacterium]MBR5917181.1 50S ribosomal protein L9 [Lachnospiraceae bacterium]